MALSAEAEAMLAEIRAAGGSLRTPPDHFPAHAVEEARKAGLIVYRDAGTWGVFDWYELVGQEAPAPHISPHSESIFDMAATAGGVAEVYLTDITPLRELAEAGLATFRDAGSWQDDDAYKVNLTDAGRATAGLPPRRSWLRRLFSR